MCWYIDAAILFSTMQSLVHFTSWQGNLIVSFWIKAVIIMKQRIFNEPGCLKLSWPSTTAELWEELDVIFLAVVQQNFLLKIWWSWCLCFDLNWKVDCFQRLYFELEDLVLHFRKMNWDEIYLTINQLTLCSSKISLETGFYSQMHFQNLFINHLVCSKQLGPKHFNWG